MSKSWKSCTSPNLLVWSVCLSWWSMHHQMAGFAPNGNMVHHRTYSLVWYSLSRPDFLSLGNMDCKFNSDSMLSYVALSLPVFLLLCQFLLRPVGWLVSPLTPDLLIPCQLQRGLQGRLCDCVCMHVWMCVCDREKRIKNLQYVPVFFVKISMLFVYIISHECVCIFTCVWTGECACLSPSKQQCSCRLYEGLF